jgi:sec-independent protein translocase protein TatA
MFGIGGGELIFIMFIVLMLFGSDKIPEMARTMGKAMAQLKNATNDIKNEIQKGAEENGLDTKVLSDIRANINTEINKAKDSILDHGKESISKPKEILIEDFNKETVPETQVQEDSIGPIKRQM